MKYVFTAFAALIGFLAGAFCAYLLYFLIYPVYQHSYPLNPTEECERGNGVAYLSMLIGGIALSIICARGYAQNYEKRLNPKVPMAK